MSVKASQRAAMWVDWLIVLVFGGSALFAIWMPIPDGIPGPRLVNTFLFLLVSLLFLLRRRAPVAVLFLVVAVVSVQANFFDPPKLPPFHSWIALLLAFYSVGRYSDERRAIFSGVVGLTAEILLVDLPRFLAGTPPLNFVPAWGSYVVLWVVGKALRRYRLQASRLQALAGQLEIEREEKARTAVVVERSRIARELHDVLAHSVSVMVVQAQAAQRLLEGEQQDARQALGSIETTGRQALAEMRRMLGILRRSDEELTLAPQPGLEYLDALIEQTREAGLPVELRIEGEPEPLPPGVDLSAYRIVQEALTNTLKHAGPAHAQVVVRYGDDELELEITDDGAGTGKGGGEGHGLIGMRERVALYGGVFEGGKRSAGGYRIRARLPLDMNRR
jgi:signal transduction histidine kinase